MKMEHLTANIDKFSRRLVEMVERSLSRYADILNGQTKYQSNSKVANRVGRTISDFIGTLIPIPGAKPLIEFATEETVQRAREKYFMQKMKKLEKLIDYFSRDKQKLRKELVSAAVDIFQSYEAQFTSVESNDDLLNLAEDAAYRLLSYCAEINEVTPDCYAQAIIKEKSENFGFLSINLSKHEVTFGLNSPKTTCKTEHLFNEVGLVMESSGNYTYYEKRNHKSKPKKFGFRRLLNNEKWEDIEQEYERYKSEGSLVKHSPYIMNPDLAEKLKDDIYKHICDDTELGELREFREECKNFQSTVLSILQEILNSRSMENSDAKLKRPIVFKFKDPTHLFIGRTEDIKELHSKVNRQCGKVTAITQSTAVSGLGGIGKTELARAYAKFHFKEYLNIVWIDAEKKANMIELFKELAQDELQISTKKNNGEEMNIQLIVKKVYESFASQKCLFIFDNAEEAKDIKEFLPPYMLGNEASNWHFLITSRWNKWDKDIELLNLNVLKIDDAILLIENGLKDNCLCEKNHVKQLVEKLQCFPLALRQAIAYINERNLNIKQYLEDYDKMTETCLNYELKYPGFDDYSKTTYTVWKITIDKIQSDEEYGETALKILQIMAHIAPDKIREDIFHSTFSKQDTDEAIDLLEKYSLINVTEDEPRKILSIHRLVQEITRLHIKEDKKQQVLSEVMTIIENNLHNEHLDHAVSAWSHVQKEEEVLKKFRFLLSKIVDELKNAVRYEEARSFGEKALESLITFMGKEDEHSLTTSHSIAEVIYKQGIYKEALDMFDDVLKRKACTLGENHASTLFTKLRKAVVLNNKGYYKECLQLCLEIVDKEGCTGSDKLSAMREKARALDNLGYEEARIAYEDLLYHPEFHTCPIEFRLHAQDEYGRALCNYGALPSALPFYREILQERERFGEENPYFLATKNDIAFVRNKLDEYSFWERIGSV